MSPRCNLILFIHFCNTIDHSLVLNAINMNLEHNIEICAALVSIDLEHFIELSDLDIS